MEQYWIAIFATFVFVFWASAKEETLYATPKDNWHWEKKKQIIQHVGGWSFRQGVPGSTRNRYSVCDFLDNILQEPNSWLLSGQIDARDVQRVDVTVRYSILPCSSIPSVNSFCKNFFNVYVWESDNKVSSDQVPHPINDNSSYRQFANISSQTSGDKTLTIPLQIKRKFIVLGFRDQGGCRELYSVKVTYKVCPGKTLTDSLVSLPQTLAPSIDFQSVQIEGSCTVDSVNVNGSLSVFCESSGEWNTSRLEGRCICNENMENSGGTCTACSDGTFNNGNGLNCTVLPSRPRSVNVSFVNQTSTMITWLPPVTTGGHVFYEVDCKKTCKDCDEKTCDKEAGLVSHKKTSNTTHVTITTLSSFVNYTCNITAKNRVSELVAARKHRVFANVTLKTQGSVPGAPDVSITQTEDAFTELSWKLKCKNGIMKKYHVTYYREDDTSDKETMTTNAEETKVRIENLAPGKTFVFEVVAENNFGKGPAGEKKFKIPKHGSASLSTFVIAGAAGGGSILLIIFAIVIIIIFHSRRGSRRNIEKDYMRTIEQGSDLHDMDQRRYIDPGNYLDLMELLSTFTSEIERSNTKLDRLIGQGEFADVYKGTLQTPKGKGVVAIKVLRPGSNEKNQKDFLSEASIMGQFNHPNVIALIGVVTQSRPMMILTEFLESGSLDNFLKARDGQLTIFQLLGMARGVANGMVYLSEMNFIHRDLAARNILVGENMACKVSDFGLSRELADDNPDSEYETQGGKIPVRWTAPEALQHRKFSSASDVWSYGILLWEILSFSDRPYWDWNNYDVISRVETGYRLPPPKGCPKVVHGLMLECWETDKNKRPKFADIVTRLDELFRFPEVLNDDLLSVKATSAETELPQFQSVDEWLKFINMEKYAEVFRAANITNLEKVIKLEDRDLRQMGINLIGHRNKMNKSIRSMKAQFVNRGLDEDEAAI